jgi:hypothetical protein
LFQNSDRNGTARRPESVVVALVALVAVVIAPQCRPGPASSGVGRLTAAQDFNRGAL